MKKKRKDKKRISKDKLKKRPKKVVQKTKKLWGLERLTFTKAAQQYMDHDYIQSLDQDDKEWLSQFNNEYYGNTLNKDWRKNLHFKEDKKAIYDQTNARNRDMFNQRYKYNENESGIPIPEHFAEYSNPEDAYIEYIHVKKKMLKFMEEARASGMSEKDVLELTAKIFDIE